MNTRKRNGKATLYLKSNDYLVWKRTPKLEFTGEKSKKQDW